MTTQYLLLDGVRYKQALTRLYGRDDQLEIEPLYCGTPWQEVADIGPILIKPGPRSSLFAESESSQEWQHSSALLVSASAMADVANHLRQLNKVSDVTGSESLLRYADPLVARFLLGSYSPAGLRQILGPVNEWRIAEPKYPWLPRTDLDWHVFTSQEAASQEPVERLGQAQMKALEKAYCWQLKERLYTWLQTNQPVDLTRLTNTDIDGWFDERLGSADAFGLTSERSIAIWCALSLRYGNDFAAVDDGTYQRWLTGQKGGRLHTADQRLQQYYQESV
ncbi:hypothetical protein CK507_02960 [Pseudomonas sp. WN033]|nr:hypothetical protein CK507_02960 [Pseudomonas sp. WN033]